jgi:hypothetical protein
MAGILRTDTIQNSNTSTIITQTNSTTITIGTTGQTVALASGASQSGFGRAGSVNWDTTPKTTGFTAVSGNGYFVNTTSGAITVNLPATPSAGDIVSIADYDGTAGTNAITVGRNSSNINGDAADLTITKNYAAISFVYVDATAGWRSVDTSSITDVQNPFISATGGTITTCGDFKIHTFTGPGTFTVTNAASSSANNEVSYLIVAGGGGGGFDWPACTGGGGGGAGGFREKKAVNDTYTASPLNGSTPITVSATTYPITVGAGGAGKPASPGIPICASPGSNSVFSTITSTGGGGGMNNSGPVSAPLRIAGNGGSGGGSTYYNTAAYGTGNSPPVSPSQGNPGGAGNTGSPNAYLSGGGGGASAAGASGTSTGNGGNGAATSITGSSVAYAGGGGGGYYGPVGSAGSEGDGGTGGGGPGGPAPGGSSGVAGTTNTGGGGGGGTGSNTPSDGPGGSGGSGIVVIRYKYQ